MINAHGGYRIVIGLSAVVVAADAVSPYVLVTQDGGAEPALPFGPFDPDGDRTLELSLRNWVSQQTGFELGYVEQLYTFGDRGRDAPLAAAPGGADQARVISVGYLGLTPERAELQRPDAQWCDWYGFFPYEDWRSARPGAIDAVIAPALMRWADQEPGLAESRKSRVRLAFALDGAPWNEERALDRYELLYEAALVREAERDRVRFRAGRPRTAILDADIVGTPMQSDHRRILATAISRLRAKIKYRPVIFELTPDLFTLSRLQRVVESVAGLDLHKQNFRRLLERTELVEGLGRFEVRTGGRPAELFRFRREIAGERPVGGVNVPAPRADA